jgi:diaminopimelate decarboxylase
MAWMVYDLPWQSSCCARSEDLMTGSTATDAQAAWVDAAAAAVSRFGTPCYVTRVRPILDALAQLDRVAPGTRSWLSFKTHPLLRLVDWWHLSGRGVEVTSEHELAATLRLGCPVDQILVNGVARQSWLTRYPIPRLRVHFDSVGEIERLLPLALECRWRVGVRVHAPDEADVRDDGFGGQFGLSSSEAITSIARLRSAGADVQSVHFHLGQRQRTPGACQRAVAHVLTICEAASFRPRVLDFGGGLPTGPDAPMALSDLKQAIQSTREQFAPELEDIWLENGRFLTEGACVLAVRIVDVKDRPEGRYLICDGGRTNHALAADHGLHPLTLLPKRRGAPRLTTICGPTCMTDDRLGRVDLPDDVAPGDCLLWMDAGAYHLPWETRFSQGLCAIAWCDETERLSLAREREHPQDWARCGY